MSISASATNDAVLCSSWQADHVAIRVCEFDAAVQWYKEKLGFELVNSAALGDRRYGILAAPGNPSSPRIELIGGSGTQERPSYADLNASLESVGLHHLAFRSPCVEAAVALLTSLGVSILLAPRDVPELRLRVAFFADPWGNIFELLETMTP